MDNEYGKREIYEFLDNTEEILQIIVNCRAVLFRKELREPIFQSWEELTKWGLELDKKRSSIFKAIKEKIEGIEEKKLEKRGLTGNQLYMKLIGFEIAYAEFKQWGTTKLLKLLLKWINNIRNSLVSAIPILEPILEFKNHCEIGIEEEGGRVVNSGKGVSDLRSGQKRFNFRH